MVRFNLESIPSVIVDLFIIESSVVIGTPPIHFTPPSRAQDTPKTPVKRVIALSPKPKVTFAIPFRMNTRGQNRS